MQIFSIEVLDRCFSLDVKDGCLLHICAKSIIFPDIRGVVFKRASIVLQS